MARAEKRIPVTEETRDTLREMKGDGTYEELLRTMIQERQMTTDEEDTGYRRFVPFL